MASDLALSFSRTRTPETLRAWLQGEPAAAAAWLKAAAQVSGAVGVGQAADAFSTAATPQALDAAVAGFTQLSAGALGAVQAARAPTLGWAAQASEDPPAITGVVSLADDGSAVLTTAEGLAFTLQNSSAWSAGDGRGDLDYHLTIGRDAQVFAGQTVTVRGWPDASWKPGDTTGSVLVEDFAPGASPDYLSGRVLVEGDRVSVRVRADKVVPITDPDFAASLKPFDMLGVVLPGAPQRAADGALSYSRPQGDFWILGGFALARDATRDGDGRVDFTMQLAHGKTCQAQVPSTAWDRDLPLKNRHYFFGHFENGAFRATTFTRDGDHHGGPVLTEQKSAAFVARTLAVDVPAATSTTGFAPAPDPARQTFSPVAAPMRTGLAGVEFVGGAAKATPGVTQGPGFLTFGPYVALPPGRYRVDFSLRAGDGPAGDLVNLEVHDATKDVALVQYMITTSDLHPTAGFVRRSLEFTVPPGDNSIELRTWWAGTVPLEVGQMGLVSLGA